MMITCNSENFTEKLAVREEIFPEQEFTQSESPCVSRFPDEEPNRFLNALLIEPLGDLTS